MEWLTEQNLTLNLCQKMQKGLMYAYTKLYNLIEYIGYSISLYSKGKNNLTYYIKTYCNIKNNII